MMLWARSLRERRTVAASLVTVSALVVGAAVSGPMLLRSVEQAALRSVVAGAPAGSADVIASAVSGAGSSVASVMPRVEAVGQAAASSGAFGAPKLIARTADELSVSVGAASSSQSHARLAAFGSGCAGIVIVAGRCPAGLEDVLVPADFGVGVGALVRVRPPGRAPVVFRVVGQYNAARSSALVPLAGDPVPEGSTPALVVTFPGLDAVRSDIAVWARANLILGRLSLDTERRARAGVAAAQRGTLAQRATVTFSSGLPRLLDTADTDRGAAAGLLAVVAIQAVALGWFSAMVVMQLIARSRAREWALGRLRGLLRRAWLGVLFGEPAVLVVTGAVVGWCGTTLMCRVVAARFLTSGARLEPWRAPVWIAVAVAVAGLLGSLVLASVRSARAPLAGLLQEGVDPQRSSRAALVGQTLVAVLTGAAVYQLAVSSSLSGRSAGVALLAPGLIAATLGLFGVRMLAAAMGLRTSRPMRTVSAVIVWRRLARTPSVLQRNVVVAVAVALAVFATQLAALSARNVVLRADAQVGAGSVWHVRVPAGTSLLEAVRSADPSGAAAMAVEELDSSTSGGTSRVVAVDTTRLARVSAWQSRWSGLSSRSLLAALHPKAPPAVMLRGSTVHLRVAAVKATGTDGSTPAAPLALGMVVSTARGWHQIDLGLLRSGNHDAHIPCTTGCRLVRMTVQNASSPADYTASFTVAAISTDRQPPSTFEPALTSAYAWQPVVSTQPLGGVVDAETLGAAAGLGISVSDGAGNSVLAVAPADVPDPLPAVLGAHTNPTVIPGQNGAVDGTGLDGGQQLLHIVGTASVLPRALDQGALVDLANATALADASKNTASDEVWVTPGSHPGIEHRLSDDGIQVISREELRTARAGLALAASARAAAMTPTLAALAGILTLAVLAATQLLDAAERNQLWFAARISGLTRVRMRRAAFLEVALPAALAGVGGVLAGLAAVQLAGSRLPLFAAHSIGPPLATQPAATEALAVAGAAVFVIVAFAATAAAWAGRRDPVT